MLNVGPLELLVVLAVALIVVGPERLPELARSVGKAMRQLRQVQDEVRDMVSSGVDDEMRQAAAEFKKATGDIARSSGVDEVVRKSGRAAGPRKSTPSGRAAASVAAGSEAQPSLPPAAGAPTPVDAEGAGPPADRLVEDGATPTAEPGTDDGAQEPATER